MLSLHGNFNEAKTTAQSSRDNCSILPSSNIFKREKKTEKEKRKLSFLAVLGRAVKVFAKNTTLTTKERNGKSEENWWRFSAKFILTLIARWCWLVGHSLTLLSFFICANSILSRVLVIFLREGNPTQVIQP
jgi:hypothetical protein